MKVTAYGLHEHIQRKEGMRTGVPTESPLSERKGKEKQQEKERDDKKL